MQSLSPDRSGWLVELLFLTVIPITLACIYFLLPVSIQQQLVLDHTEPIAYTFWTNAFVHEPRPGDSHVIGNVVGYTLLIFPCWALYHLRERRRIFWTGFIIILTIGPFIISLSSYAAYHEILGLHIKNDRGFSGVVGAIDGFLLMSILQTFAQDQDEKVSHLSMGLYFSYLILGFGAITFRPVFLAFGVLVLALVFIGTRTEYIAAPEMLSNWCIQNRKLSIVIATAALVSTMAFAASLPADITTSSGGFKNIVAHGAGILFGMGLEVALRYVDV